MNNGSAADRFTSSVIAASSGGPAKRLAASSTLGSRPTSPTLSRNTPGRLSTHHTARSMSFRSWSGSYQVARVGGRPSQGRWAIDLMGFLLLQLILGDADARAPTGIGWGGAAAGGSLPPCGGPEIG